MHNYVEFADRTSRASRNALQVDRLLADGKLVSVNDDREYASRSCDLAIQDTQLHFVLRSMLKSWVFLNTGCDCDNVGELLLRRSHKSPRQHAKASIQNQALYMKQSRANVARSRPERSDGHEPYREEQHNGVAFEEEPPSGARCVQQSRLSSRRAIAPRSLVVSRRSDSAIVRTSVRTSVP